MSIFVNLKTCDNKEHFPLRRHTQRDYTNLLAAPPKVSIIIPIYNAFNETVACINSILCNTQYCYELYLIDDCSTDLRIEKYCNSLSIYSNIHYIKNSANLGFTRSVNKGIQLTSTDIILLNSDTRVTNRWIIKLILAAYSDSKVMTATPFSNAAGAFNMPNIGINSDLPPGLSLNQMSQIISKNSKNRYPEVPTGNGFCMYIKREAFFLAGLFDEVAFGKGYGEENDFCMKLLRKSYKNVICDNLYIFHQKAASFKEAAQRLAVQHRTLLEQRYPEYKNVIKVFYKDKYLRQLRRKVKKDCLTMQIPYQKVLFVYTSSFNECKAKSYPCNSHCFVLNIYQNIYSLYRISNSAFKYMVCIVKKTMTTYEEINNWYIEVLENLHIDILYFNSKTEPALGIDKIAKFLKIQTFYY